jgi:hypothetical protein
VRILLAFPEQEEEHLQIITQQLRSQAAGKGSLALVRVFNEEDALLELRRTTPNLRITALNIPNAVTVPLDTAAERGVALAEKVWAARPNLPIIIFSDYLDAPLQNRLRYIHSCKVFSKEEPDWQEKLSNEARSLVQKSAPLPSSPSLVDIRLDKASRTGIYSIRSPRVNRSCGILSNLDFTTLEQLVDESRKVISPEDESHKVICPDPPAWRQRWITLGVRFHGLLFRGQTHFTRDLKAALEGCSSEQGLRVRFIIEQNLSPLLLEAATEDGNDPWLLRNPTLRTIPTYQFDIVPFTPEKPEALKCRIVEAPTEGPVPDFSVNGERYTLRALDYAGVEANDIEWYLGTQGLKVERLGPIGGKPPSLGDLQAKLSAQEWDMVHFIGHSYAGEAGSSAVLFLQSVTPLPFSSAT